MGRLTKLSEKQWISNLKKEGFSNLTVCSMPRSEESPGEHTHEEHTVHVILDGELTIEDELGLRKYIKGDRVEFPAGTKHKAHFGPNGLTMIVGDKESDLPKLAAPAKRALASAGIKTLKDFLKITEKEFKNLHGIGPNAFKTIQAELKSKGIDFRNN